MIFFLISVSLPLLVSSRTCHKLSEHCIYHLATKTPYRFVQNTHIWGDNPKCKAEKIVMIIRHGTRNPSEKVINNMRENLSELKSHVIANRLSGQLCDETVNLLDTWETQIKPEEAKILTHEGEEEMIALAERYQQRFPELLPEIYSSSYEFRTTDTQRSIESLKHFATGLFGRKTARDVWFPTPIYEDPLLRFYKLCPQWKTNVYKNLEAYQERLQFENSTLFGEMIKRVSKRLGFRDPLPLGTIKLMYTTCAFETAWFPHKNCPWCHVFSQEDLQLLEYAEDLKYFWISGYGFPINYNQACVLTNHIKQIFSNSSSTKAYLYFTHAGVIFKLLAHLGLYQDSEPLRHDNFKMNRLWRSGKIVAFGTNLAFVLYDCSGEKVVKIYHQEREVSLPNISTCSLEDFNDLFGSCNFSEICRIK